jgi:hypothetical protein
MSETAESIIGRARMVIKDNEHRIWVAESLKRGILYEIEIEWMGHQQFLVRMSQFNTDSVRFQLFASQIVCRTGLTSWNFWNIKSIKEVSLKDLVLYVGWKWKSTEFEKLLNGKSKLRWNYAKE